MVTSKLNLKLIRDLRFSPLMFGGIVLLVAVGVMLFVAAYSLYLNLQSSYATSYSRLNLADFSVQVQSAPQEVLSTLRQIPGVGEVEGRTIEEVEMEQPEMISRKVEGRIISLPDIGEPKLNQLKLLSGAYPRQDSARELLLESSFAGYYGYRPGDSLNIVILDDKVKFRIAGIVQSPEYIYVVRGRGYPLPNPRTFGVMWMRKGMVDEMFGTSGSVNDVEVGMAPGGNRRTAMRLASKILSPYGADEPVASENQASVELLRLDLAGHRRLAIFFPILFFTISSLSIYNLLGRMVYSQRSQIGFMRAVGFSRLAIGVHYLEFSILVGVAGGGIGGVAGYYIGIWVTKLGTTLVQIPYYNITPRWGVIAVGIISALLVIVVSGAFPALSAARLVPAQAIRAEAPIVGRVPIIERYLPFLDKFTLLSRLPLRNFLRNIRRTVSMIAGVVSAVTLMLVSYGLLDSMKASIDFYLTYSIHYDILAAYLHPQDQVAMERIERWKGVIRAEPVLVLPAKLVHAGRSQNILVYGLRPGDRLMLLVEPDGRKVDIAKVGLMVPELTAKKLKLRSGGRVRITLPKQTIPETPDAGATQTLNPLLRAAGIHGPSPRQSILGSSRALLETKMDRPVQVSAVTYQPVGSTAYASIEQVRLWYGRPLDLPPKAINAVAIKVEPKYLQTVERKLYGLDGVASAEVVRYIREEIQRLLSQSSVFFNAMLAFSIVLAAVIMFNSTLMNVIERTREIATLRTMGVSVRSASLLITAESIMAYVVGIMAGVPFGSWLAGRFVGLYESESFNMQAVIFPGTYWIAILGVLATILIAQLPGILYIRKIELTKATKDIG
ncbi:MAG TPA: hypothetical protein DCL60_00265 [Armatimonadetes bacterium]|nr:hypothetical protein [Armatimonadota bacterium]